MDSAGVAAVLLSCVGLSMAAAGSAASEKPLILSRMCPVHLDHMKLMGNVQSSCVGQTIPQRRCCAAFKNFLCPYRATLNDIDNGCAARMMARIHQLCQVPKGYFVMCGDTPDGITC